MRAAIRENAWCALAALCGCAALAWLGLYAFAWNDYDNEARAAVDALAHGHLTQFLQLAPVYGGSLVERAPFALVPGLWGAALFLVLLQVMLNTFGADASVRLVTTGLVIIAVITAAGGAKALR